MPPSCVSRVSVNSVSMRGSQNGCIKRARELKLAWTRTALEWLEASTDGRYGYTAFAVSRANLRRLHQLHLQYVHAMQEVIANSSPSECVALYGSQLLSLDGRYEDSAATSRQPATASTAGRQRLWLSSFGHAGPTSSFRNSSVLGAVCDVVGHGPPLGSTRGGYRQAGHWPLEGRHHRDARAGA